MLRLNPQTLKKLRRFREIKRGYYSFLILSGLLAIVSIGELLVNSRAVLVNYQGALYFPTYTAFHPGTDFGLDYLDSIGRCAANIRFSFYLSRGIYIAYNWYTGVFFLK